MFIKYLVYDCHPVVDVFLNDKNLQTTTFTQIIKKRTEDHCSAAHQFFQRNLGDYSSLWALIFFREISDEDNQHHIS